MKDTAIIWDLDGTLLDTLQDLTDATNYILDSYGLPRRTVAEIRSFVGNGARNQMRLALPGKPDDPDLEEVLSAYQTYYAAHCQNETKPYDGILEVLEELGKVYPMAVVSNKPDKAVKTLAKQYFPSLYALGEHPGCPRKPAADMVWQAMEILGVKNCIYIGDSEVDVATAKAAGVPCLSVAWGFRDREELEKAGAVWLCEEISRIPEIVARMEEHYGK